MKATNWHKRSAAMFEIAASAASQRTTAPGVPGVIIRVRTVGTDDMRFLDLQLSPDEAAALALELQIAARAAGHKVQR